MADPALALQGAVNQRLRAEVGAVDGRIYDRVPTGATMPYIEIGEFQSLDDGAECHDGYEVFVPLHVWSRPGEGRDPGQETGKSIASAVHSALDKAELALGADWQFLEIAWRDTRYLKESDGVTSHAVITFRALIAAA